jgi:hypothetical protein
MRTLAPHETMSFAPGELWGPGGAGGFGRPAAGSTPAQPRGLT